MANRMVNVHAGFYGMGIYAIMLPSSGFSVAHCLQQPFASGQHRDSTEATNVSSE